MIDAKIQRTITGLLPSTQNYRVEEASPHRAMGPHQ